MRNNCIGIRKSRLDSVLNCKDVKFNIDSILMESMFLHPWRENNGKTTLMFFQHLTFQDIIMYSAQTLNRLLSFLLCAAYTSPVLPPPIFITTDYYYLDGFFEMNKVNLNHKVSIFKISFPRVNWMHGFYAPDTVPFSYLESLFLFCGFLNILKKHSFKVGLSGLSCISQNIQLFWKALISFVGISRSPQQNSITLLPERIF